MAQQEIQVTRENFQELNNETRKMSKNHNNPVKDNTLKLRKLIKKPTGMNGNYYEMNVNDYLVKKDKKIDSAFLVLNGTVRVIIGNDEIEKSFKKFEIINIKLIQSL